MMHFIELLEDIPDPRMEGKVKHNLKTILFTSLCGVLSGCDSWEDISAYTKEKHVWLSNYVEFKNGVPSPWTYRRLFTLLSPDCIEALLKSYVRHVLKTKNSLSDHISIDGKALCGSKNKEGLYLHSLSAFCHEHGLVIGEEKIEEKSNEIKAIPLLLEHLDLKDTTVSIDAAGCQKNIVKQICDQKGHYVLGLKGNHPKLLEAVKQHIQDVGEHDGNRLHDAFDESHGRTVRRRYFGYDVTELPLTQEWSGLKTVVAVESVSSKKNDPHRKVTSNWRYYISNHHHLNDQLPRYVRNHWGIENKLHWVLDVQMNEDDDQKIERKSARSFALLKRISLNIVRSKKEEIDQTQSRKKKMSMKLTMKKAGWSNDWLLFLLEDI